MPLTPIQDWYLQQDWSEPHHFNQALLLQCRAPLSPAHVAAALAQVVAQHDALRLRFTPTATGWHQHHADADGALAFEQVDLSAVAASQQGAALTRAAERLPAGPARGAGPPGAAAPRP